MKVLSVRQPWAWFIFCGLPGWKDVENRSWFIPHTGNLLVHAAKTMTDEEYDIACEFAIKTGLGQVPVRWRLKFGGIVGMVRVVKCVRIYRSPWFTGPFGAVLADPFPLPFTPYQGERGLFDFHGPEPRIHDNNAFKEPEMLPA